MHTNKPNNKNTYVHTKTKEPRIGTKWTKFQMILDYF